MEKQPTKRSPQNIYAEIREMILSFQLYPGSRVTETQLAERFGVSRTPIRAALQRLQSEGYVTVRPKQGCFVRNLDIGVLAEYYQVRVALEMLSLDRACTYMSEAALRELARAWDPTRQEGGDEGPENMEALDESFHMALAEGGGNSVLAHYLDDINGNIRVIRRLDFTDQARINVTFHEHFEICQHLLRRDVQAAKRTMRAHIKASESSAKNLTLTQLAKSRPRVKLDPHA